jgi:hypothetical protein
MTAVGPADRPGDPATSYRRHHGRNAIALLDEVAAAGAALIKWLPPVHNIDAHDPRTIAFLRRCAELRLPLLIHYGPEFTLGTHRPQAADPRAMFDTLRALRRDGTMPTVIVAHLATPVLWPFTPGTHFRQLVDALTGEFADAPLYADTSALAAPSKVYWLRKILAMTVAGRWARKHRAPPSTDEARPLPTESHASGDGRFRSPIAVRRVGSYGNWSVVLLKTSATLSPRSVIVPIQVTMINPSITAYSVAVGPSSDLRKFLTRFNISLFLPKLRGQRDLLRPDRT